MALKNEANLSGTPLYAHGVTNFQPTGDGLERGFVTIVCANNSAGRQCSR